MNNPPFAPIQRGGDFGQEQSPGSILIDLLELWIDPLTNESISATLDAQGKCLLRFDLSDMSLSIALTRDSICAVLLGAKIHFASPEGACELRLIGEEVEIRVRQWQGEERVVLIAAETLNAASTQIFPPTLKKKVDWQ